MNLEHSRMTTVAIPPLVVGLLVWAASYFGSDLLQGIEGRKRPTVSFAEHQRASGLPEPLAVGELPVSQDGDSPRSTVSPEEKQALKAKAHSLLTAIGQAATSEEKSDLLLEALDVLRQVLEIDPKDSDSLLVLADISFEQRLFQKAVQYFEAYVGVRPDDLAARARYASSLSFVGQTERSIQELNDLLVVDPKNFQGLAFLAIAYAQKGERTTARIIGEKALAVAPHQEARDRLQAFLNKLDQEDVKAQPSAQQPQQKEMAGLAQSFVDALKSNPVAGSKFVDGGVSEDTLVLRFRDFPMQAMPPFAREKFLATLRNLPDAPAVSNVLFIDAETNQLLGEDLFQKR
jgi:tetratricopeptide (TPR) repeat protein